MLSSLALASALALAGPDVAPDEVTVAAQGDRFAHPGLATRAGWQVAGDTARVVVVEAELGAWWAPRDAIATYARGGALLRYKSFRGTTWGPFLHVGAIQGVSTAPTFVVRDATSSAKSRLTGRTHALGVVGVEVGHTLVTGPIAAWHVRPQVGVRVAGIDRYDVDVNLQVGLRFGGER